MRWPRAVAGPEVQASLLGPDQITSLVPRAQINFSGPTTPFCQKTYGGYCLPPLEPKIFVPKEGREEITGHIFDLPWAEITFVQLLRPKGTKSEGFPLPLCIIMATLPKKTKQKRWWTWMKHTMTLLVSNEMLGLFQTFLQKKPIKTHLPALPVRPSELG